MFVSSFVNFCLEHETNLITTTNNSILELGAVNFKNPSINLPRLSSSTDGGLLNSVILSDGSTIYLPFSMRSSSFGKKVSKFNNAMCIKFIISKSDLFSSLR